MSSEPRLLATLGAMIWACLLSCADLSRGPASSQGPADAGPEVGGQSDSEVGSDDGASVSFAAVVHPLLISGCQRCHAAGGEAGDTQLLFTGAVAADYAAVSRLVDTSAAAGSRLLSKATGNGHGGGAIFPVGSPEYQNVLQWIQQGARP